MPINAVAEAALPKAPPPRRRVWVYMFIGLLVVISFGYFSLNNSRDNFANNDFYRILYEASNKFNENLNQLDKMHVYGESLNSIRTQFPSYQPKHKNLDTHKSFKYSLDGQKIEVKKDITNGNEIITIEAELQIADILPFPKQGFSQYLFASGASEVLATVGDEKTISIDNLSGINKEIEKSKRRYQFNLSELQSSGTEGNKHHLPSYSSHVDMKLSHEEFRIFIFPFSLDTPLRTAKNETINTLYLVGLLPKHKLHNESSGHWNLLLFLVTLVSLLFMWTLLRLYLLPNNQSITPFYRNFTMVSSYGFFIVLIALVLAFMQKTALQVSKDSEAATYAGELFTQLEKDLEKTFAGLADYRDFYHNLLSEIDKPKENSELDGAESNDGVFATDNFSHMIKKSLVSTISSPCTDNADYHLLPNYAFTVSKAYPITHECVEVNEKEEWRVYIELDQSAEQVLLKAHQKSIRGTDNLGFMAGNLNPNVKDKKGKPSEFKEVVESYISPGQQYLHTNIFTVFAINGDGNTTLPPIYFQEYNASPQVINLTHRDYYKRVRDHQGWELSLCSTAEEKLNRQCQYNNVYIQRVLNMGDGTRGTTISMPMFDKRQEPSKPAYGLAYILAADVILPSLSLAAPAPYDFTYMVIDRNSGDVLFHSDESRTLVENLFYSGNSKSNLSEWIKAGLDHYPEVSKEKMIEGHYHGKPGRFMLIPAPVNAWAIVVFYPNDSLDALMASQVLLISVSLAIALLVLVGLLIVCRHFFCVNALKNKLSIPMTINGRMILMIGAMIFSVIYSLYYIGLVFDLAIVEDQQKILVALILPSIGVLILLFYLLHIGKNYFVGADSNNHNRPIAKGLKTFFSVIILLTIIQLYYLHSVARMPLKALDFHYQQVYCNWLNFERQESIKIALSRYPNSITQQRVNPFSLLPLTANSPENLNDKGFCKGHSSGIEPRDYLNLSTLLGVTYLWQWITSLSTESPAIPTLTIQKKDLMTSWLVVSNGIFVLIIVWVWLVFLHRTLWRRLYCSNQFLQHIERLTKSKPMLEQHQDHTKLIIECDRVKLNGVGLTLLLRNAVINENKLPELKGNNLSPGFDTLYQLSPCLQNFGVNNNFLPNLKIKVEENSDNQKLDVQIWDIETCLAQPEFRQHLLDMIMEIKSLTLASQLNSFTIFTGYQSLQRVKMKDPLSIEKSLTFENTEYLPWSECLMDFNVKVAKVFEHDLDRQFLKKEIAGFPELYYLSSNTLDTAELPNEENLWKKREDPNIEAQWATINYILLRAEALYRFKWESCSNAEKLALLNLDKQHGLNPTNTQMIEHLALNGLVRVKQGRLEIVNKSFAHFIRNAETTDTINHLVNQSEAGFWKDYQLPLGLVMILIIGGIALTSGESIYIIAASVAGVIGTIASVANSARMLGGQPK